MIQIPIILLWSMGAAAVGLFVLGFTAGNRSKTTRTDPNQDQRATRHALRPLPRRTMGRRYRNWWEGVKCLRQVRKMVDQVTPEEIITLMMSAGAQMMACAGAGSPEHDRVDNSLAALTWVPQQDPEFAPRDTRF